VSVSDAYYYKIRVLSEAFVAGETLVVYRDDPGTTLTAYNEAQFHPVNANQQRAMTSDDYEDWNILAAATLAVWRHDLDNTGETFVAFSEACTGGGSGCCNQNDDGEVHVSDSGATYKYQIAHEFGHCVLLARTPGYGSGSDQSALPGNGCDRSREVRVTGAGLGGPRGRAGLIHDLGRGGLGMTDGRTGTTSGRSPTWTTNLPYRGRLNARTRTRHLPTAGAVSRNSAYSALSARNSGSAARRTAPGDVEGWRSA
jgi:hypothetical protein